jgi:hypothetical protein
MTEKLFRCSSIGRLMTDPVSYEECIRTPELDEIIAKKKRTDEEKEMLAQLKASTLSAGAKTYVREIAQQDILGVEFEFSSKETEKGNRLEPDAIALVNRVRGMSLEKNTERKSNGLITGEADLFNAPARRGHDTKVSWSAKTFPAFVEDAKDSIYEWQCRGYMALWDADEWEVNWVLLDTPEDLIGYEPPMLHAVSHIPEHMRLTSWVIKRDLEKEARIHEKVKAARDYYAKVVQEFDRTHQP